MRECTLTMRKSCKIWSACSLAYGGGEDLPPCIKESPSTDVQQLKAEIAAMIDWYDAPLGYGGNTVNRTQLLDKLRQLLAV